MIKFLSWLQVTLNPSRVQITSSTLPFTTIFVPFGTGSQTSDPIFMRILVLLAYEWESVYKKLFIGIVIGAGVSVTRFLRSFQVTLKPSSVQTTDSDLPSTIIFVPFGTGVQISPPIIRFLVLLDVVYDKEGNYLSPNIYCTASLLRLNPVKVQFDTVLPAPLQASNASTLYLSGPEGLLCHL